MQYSRISEELVDEEDLVLKASVASWDDISIGVGYYKYPKARLANKIPEFQKSRKKYFLPYFAQGVFGRELVIDNFIYKIDPGSAPFLFEVGRVLTDICTDDLNELTGLRWRDNVQWTIVYFSGNVIIFDSPMKVHDPKGYSITTWQARRDNLESS